MAKIIKSFQTGDSIACINVYSLQETVNNSVSDNCVKEDLKDNKIIDVEEIMAVANVEKERILQEARIQAEQIISESSQEALRIKKEAWESGYKEGVEQGINDAKDKTTEIIKEAKQIFQMALEEKEKIIREALPVIMELAIMTAEKIIRRSIEMEHEIVFDIAKGALEKVSHAKEVVLRCNSPSASLINGNREVLNQVVNGRPIQIEEDNSIELGGCLVETELGIIDGRIENQLAEIRAQLLEMIGYD